MSDLECSEGSYCHVPTKGPVHSRCQTCRRRNRRCHRDGMCCPGNRCSISKIILKMINSNPKAFFGRQSPHFSCYSLADKCVPDVESFPSQRIPDTGEDVNPLSKKKGWRKKDSVNIKRSSSKGEFSLLGFLLIHLFVFYLQRL